MGGGLHVGTLADVGWGVSWVGAGAGYLAGGSGSVWLAVCASQQHPGVVRAGF